MRLHLPVSTSTWDLVVRKPTAEHVSVRSAAGDDLDGISKHFAEQTSDALRWALREVSEARPDTWAVVEVGKSAGWWLAWERTERLDIRCADQGGGKETAEAVRRAFERLGVLVAEPVPGTGDEMNHSSIALHGKVIFGVREAAEVEAELVPEADRKVPRLEGPNWPPVKCPGCGAERRPTALSWGYPTPWTEPLIKLLAEETEDRMALTGCIIPASGYADWACSGCEAHLHPGWLTADKVAEAALQDCKPVPRCPRGRPRHDELLWTPQAETEGESQRYAVAPGIAARLDDARGAWVGFRPKNGATLFVTWAAIREVALGPIERPLAFSTRLGRQAVRVRGHLLPAKLVI